MLLLFLFHLLPTTKASALFNSVSSGLVAPVAGLDKEVDVRAPDDPVVCSRLKNLKMLHNLSSLFVHLLESRGTELADLIRQYPSLFGDAPACTHLVEHDIDVGYSVLTKQHFCRCKQKIMESEVKYMLDNNIAVPLSSSWASPCQLVDKPDKTHRFCTD